MDKIDTKSLKIMELDVKSNFNYVVQYKSMSDDLNVNICEKYQMYISEDEEIIATSKLPQRITLVLLVWSSSSNRTVTTARIIPDT